MAAKSDSEVSKKINFLINSSSKSRTRLYKTSDRGLLEPVNDLDIVESLLVQIVQSVFKDKNVVLLKSCLKTNHNSPSKSKKNVRLLLPPDSRENIDELTSEQLDSSKKVRFLLPAHSKEVPKLPSDSQDDSISDSQDVSTLDDVDTLQELDLTWDEVSLEHDELKSQSASEIAKNQELKPERKETKNEYHTLKEQMKTTKADKNERIEPPHDSEFCRNEEACGLNYCGLKNLEYCNEDFETVETETEWEFRNEDSEYENMIYDTPSGTSKVILRKKSIEHISTGCRKLYHITRVLGTLCKKSDVCMRSQEVKNVRFPVFKIYFFIEQEEEARMTRI